MAKQSLYQKILQEVQAEYPDMEYKKQQFLALEKTQVADKENSKIEKDNAINMAKKTGSTVPENKAEEAVEDTTEKIEKEGVVNFTNCKATNYADFLALVKESRPDVKHKEQLKLASKTYKDFKEWKKNKPPKNQATMINSSLEDTTHKKESIINNFSINDDIPQKPENPKTEAPKTVMSGETQKSPEIKKVTVMEAVERLELSERARDIEQAIKNQYMGHKNHIPNIMISRDIGIDEYVVRDDHKEGANTLCYVMLGSNRVSQKEWTMRVPQNPIEFFKIFK